MTDVNIQASKNGPLLVKGNVQLTDAEGKAIAITAQGQMIALCRCGQSSRKPFCDGTHKKVGFQG